MRRNKSEGKWRAWYQLAETYYHEHGDLMIPRDYVCQGKQLGRWIERQRAAYQGKGGCEMTSDRRIALNTIGMVWQLENRRDWNCWFDMAQAYYHSNGNLFVPKKYTTDGCQLGFWIGEQRKKYKHGKLSAAQIHKLESIGMRWQLTEPRLQWQLVYEEAKAYFLRHGNLCFPCDYRTESGILLHHWVQRQREAYNGTRPTKLSNKQIRALEQIGMQWSCFEQSWNLMYMAAYAYRKTYGNLQIKQAYVTEEGLKLGQWISSQRQSYRKQKGILFKNNGVQRLGEIGMVWNEKRY